MRHKFEGADGVCDTFKIIALSVCKIIHRIGFPFVACDVVFLVDDAVDHWVAKVHVRVCHVYLGAEHHRTFSHLAAIHFFKQTEIFFYWSVSVGAVGACLCRRALLSGNLFACLLVNVGLSFLYEAYGEIPQLLKIVRGMINIAPLESKPLDVFFDGFNVFGVFLLRIGVVQTQVAHTAKFLGDAKVHTYSFRMSDV